jgi:hypothetical protein
MPTSFRLVLGCEGLVTRLSRFVFHEPEGAHGRGDKTEAREVTRHDPHGTRSFRNIRIEAMTVGKCKA